MPSYCASFGCNNSTGNICVKRKYVSFHRFPLKNEKLLKMWLINMRRADFVPNVTSRICSEHFEENCFDYQNFTNRRSLKSDAVPTIFSFPTNEETFHKRRRYSELLFGYHRKPEYDTDDPDGALATSDAVLSKGKPSQDSNHPDYVPNIFVDKPATNENERSREEIHEKDVNNTANNLVEMDVSWEPICEIKEGKPSQESNHSDYDPNIQEKKVSDTSNNLVEMDVNWEPICQIDEGKPSQDSNHPDNDPNIFVSKPATNEKERSGKEIHEKNINDTINNLVEMDVEWKPICQIDKGETKTKTGLHTHSPRKCTDPRTSLDRVKSFSLHLGEPYQDSNHPDGVNLLDKSSDRVKSFSLCLGKPPQDSNDPDYVNNIFAYKSATNEKERSRDEIHEKNISNIANNLVEVDVNLARTCQIQKEVPAVENIIVKQEIEIEDGTNTSASENMKEMSTIKIVHVKQEAEHENNEIITVAEQMKEISAFKIVDARQEAEHEKNEIITVAGQIKESLLNDELRQTRIELQHAYTKINTLVAEKNKLIQKLDAAVATQNALFAAKSKQDDELKRAKLDLQLAYDKDSFVAKKNELMRALDDAKATNNSLLAAISEKECEFSKVKKELQQAYSEINALRKEKEELSKKVPASDLYQSIFQSEKKLRFYTGLNSAKDFQAVLSLLSPDQSGTKILPFDAQVLIVLIKIKWNFRNVDLSYRFNISMNAVQRMCSTLIPILETKLELIVNGPVNKALKRNIPQNYKNSVYENLYQRMQRSFKTKNKDDESNEPDME